jgi:MFS family permease
LLLATIPLFIGLTAPLAGSLSDRFGTRPISLIGLVFLVIGYIALTTLSVDTDRLGYALRLVPLGLGMGIFQSPNNSAIMGAVPRHYLGVASGMLAFTRTLGQVNGVALMSALWAARTWFHFEGEAAGDVTAAPAAAQVAGMHDTFVVVTVAMALALGLSVWGLIRAHRLRHSVALTSEERT